MPANLPIVVGTEIDADILNEISGIEASKSFLLTSSLSPLTSTAGSAGTATIISGSFDFVAGYAYEITMACRWVMAGGTTTATEGRSCLFGLRRATAAGTAIYNSGREMAMENAGSASDGHHFSSSTVVKCTTADTTQTICFVGQFDNNLGVVSTSLTIQTNGSVTPGLLCIKRIGLADNHPDAVEIPTS